MNGTLGRTERHCETSLSQASDILTEGPELHISLAIGVCSSSLGSHQLILRNMHLSHTCAPTEN